eukprot:CAMPEP_0113580490 /NCGR_PEP_ID=MMETSP0015_2-20120614/30713_1 /TAXON_ID=2838 /ORGANISM="Odontella" /LENGTH=90 /DNA_ID=CAMNT_0000484707 /DNA_START=130 /DNA_END=398 /DNA_ORIENTATION=- /assembly_acc=CAM_ASM_000160
MRSNKPQAPQASPAGSILHVVRHPPIVAHHGLVHVLDVEQEILRLGPYGDDRVVTPEAVPVRLVRVRILHVLLPVDDELVLVPARVEVLG